MTTPLLEEIVNAVLYEGYMLYPYRASSQKNRRERFTFGRVYPKDYGESQQGAEPCLKQTECLLQALEKEPTVDVTVRFLQPMWREVGSVSGDEGAAFAVAPELRVAGHLDPVWQEATERAVTVTLGPLRFFEPQQMRLPFSFPAHQTVEILGDASSRAAIRRRQEAVMGAMEVEAEPLSSNIFKMSVRILNHTPITAAQCEDQDAIIMRTFASTHTILQAAGGEFVSMMDPLPGLAEFVSQCKNIGTWPVLVGEEARSQRDTILSSPIILYDYRKSPRKASAPFSMERRLTKCSPCGS